MRFVVMALVLGVQATGLASARAGQPTQEDVRWEVASGEGRVRVTKPARWNAGFTARTSNLAPDDENWRRFLVVVSSPRDSEPDPHKQPAVLGTYRLEGEDLVFTLRFPVAAEVAYHAFFDPAGTADWRSKAVVHKRFLPPTRERPAATKVTRVYPTSDKLPENQLKLYVHFSAPMSQGEAYRHVRLMKANGEKVQFPFLELGEELWDASGQRFTLFFDPGRIKRGLKPREEMGPALEEGRRYVLVIDAAWRDAEGNPLQSEFRKSFLVGPPDDRQPDPRDWKFTHPTAGTKEPLVAAFPEPLDHALTERLLRVVTAAGEVVAGKVAITDEEKVWRFTPEQPWSGQIKYELHVPTFLEDLAGNSIAKPFEVDVFLKVDRETRLEVLKLPIELRGK